MRELENVLERAAIVCGGQLIEPRHLPLEAGAAPAAVAPESAAAQNLSIPLATEVLERRLIEQALLQTGGNKSKAARLLEISERSLWYKLERYQDTPPAT